MTDRKVKKAKLRNLDPNNPNPMTAFISWFGVEFVDLLRNRVNGVLLHGFAVRTDRQDGWGAIATGGNCRLPRAYMLHGREANGNWTHDHVVETPFAVWAFEP